ncbi:MAG: histidine phosphatase family protein [Anaerolineae bacterium]
MLSSDTTLVYFVRHGETDWNEQRRFQGQADRVLNLIGLDQAVAVARWLAETGIEFSALYSSDLQRCVETAEEISKRTPLPIITTPALREIDCGLWEGLTSDEIEARFPGQLTAWRSHVALYVIPGGESVLQVQARMSAFYHETLAKHPGETIIIVSHGAALAALFAELENLPLGQVWNDPLKRLKNTSVTVMLYDHTLDAHITTLFNSVEHLLEV